MKGTRRPHPSRKPGGSEAPSQSRGGGPRRWHAGLALFLAAFAAYEAYQPALRGPFVFDDLYLPFLVPGYAELPLKDWLVGYRPLLMFSFWANHRLFGPGPYWFHQVNFLLHLATASAAALILWKLLGQRESDPYRKFILSAGLGGVFLLHPLQTEAVSYVASRSDVLSTLLIYLVFAAFLFRRAPAIGWRRSLLVLMLFGAAAVTKENAAVLPVWLVAADYYFNPGFTLEGIRKNWRLYGLTVIAGAAGAAAVWKVLREADTAGFAMKDLPWHQYFFTQCRAIWAYLGLFVFPARQNIDHDFAISRSILNHGAIFGLAALTVLLAAAWLLRRRLPLASFGVVTFLILIAPTSSFAPIRDPFVERRMYVPMIGLLLVAAEFLLRWPASRAKLAGGLAALLLLLAAATAQRNQVWTSSLALWADSAAKSPRKARPRFQYAYALYEAGRCGEAAGQYAVAAELQPPDYRMLVDWALAEDCAQQYAAALAHLRLAAEKEGTAHVYSLIGMVHAKRNEREQAMEALARAQRRNPDFAMTYVYRGNIHFAAAEFKEAIEQYRLALERDDQIVTARDGLARAQEMLRRRGERK